jgi:hypothetical protein
VTFCDVLRHSGTSAESGDAQLALHRAWPLSCETCVVSVLSMKTSRDLWKLGMTRENSSGMFCDVLRCSGASAESGDAQLDFIVRDPVL